MVERSNKVLLYTGGIDSWTAWHLNSDYLPVYVDINGRYQEQERNAQAVLRSMFGGPKVVRIKGPDLGQFEEPDANVPLRNAFLLMLGSYFLDDNMDGKVLALVAQKGEQSIPDRAPAFFSRTTDYLEPLWDGRKGRISIRSVFGHMTKCRAVGAFLNMGGDPRSLLYCFSCYDETSDHIPPNGCGRCGACFRKWVALVFNDVKGWESCFVAPPYEWEGAKEYRVRAESGSFDPERALETLSVLERFGV